MGIKIKLKEEESKLRLCIEVIDGLKALAKFTESICTENVCFQLNLTGRKLSVSFK